MESPFDEEIGEIANDSLAATQRYAAKRQRWEENVVKRLLSVAGRDRLAVELMHRHHQRTGEHLVTFDDFKAELPQFPMLLGFEKPTFKALVKAEQQMLNFRKADKNILVKLFYDHKEELPETHRECFQGVVFEWLHHGSPYKLIHNQPLLMVYHPWTRIALSLPNTLENLYIEDLDSYLHTVQWSSNAQERRPTQAGY